jgi:hypothetical protein
MHFDYNLAMDSDPLMIMRVTCQNDWDIEMPEIQSL